MANIDIAVKDITYGFEQSELYDKAREIAVNTAKVLYDDEREFQNEEYQAMFEDGDVASYEEYRDAVGVTPDQADYRKTFEENINHPQIASQIEKLTNQYMCNVLDLPRDAVVTIDDNTLDEKGRPDESVLRQALREKFGETANPIHYEKATEAEKKDTLSQKAYEKVGDMLKSDDYQTYLDLRASIGKYSSNNISLIYLQKPDSKAVMGYNAWQKLDRQVPAGTTGLAIWQPCKKELKTEAQVDKYIADNEWEYGKPDSKRAIKAKENMMKEIETEGKTEVSFGFRLGTVFDIGQTVPKDPENDRLDQIINLNKPLAPNMENFDAIVKSMKDAGTILPLTVSQNDSQQEALWNAVLKYADKVLSECPEQVQGIKSNVPLHGDMHTMESVMTAHLICRHIGIECEDKASLQLAGVFDKKQPSEQMFTHGKREMFTKAFDRAVKVADQFNKAFDKSFGYDLEAQREELRKTIAAEQAKKEEEFKAKAATRVWFGRTPMQRVDEWKDNNFSYTLAQSEKTSGFFVKVLDENKKSVTLKGEDGKPLRFDEAPSRGEVASKIYEQSGVDPTLKSAISFDVLEVSKPNANTALYAFDLTGDAVVEAVKRAELHSPAISEELAKFNGNVTEMLAHNDYPHTFYSEVADDSSATLKLVLPKQDVEVAIPVSKAEQADFVAKFEIYNEAEQPKEKETPKRVSLDLD